MFKLALASLWNRRASAWLTLLAIAVSTLLLVGVERVRTQTQANFANTIAGTDLIVGARTGSTQLLLSSVFHIGSLSNTISWQTYQQLQTMAGVKWHIPMAMGDSVAGYPVVATNQNFFQHFRYGSQEPLTLATGSIFASNQQAVVGAEVAQRLQLKPQQQFNIAHGSGGVSFSDHEQHPFTVAGVLKYTGTPVDQAIYIPLEGLSSVHGDAEIYTLSAVLIGLESRPLALRLMRQINTYKPEPLTAIMPGLALTELWRTLSLFEKALVAISALVVATGLLGMLTTLLASLRERRREMAVLRALGASPIKIFLLLISEAVMLTAVGVSLGMLLLFSFLWFGSDWLLAETGMLLRASMITPTEWLLLSAILLSAFILSLIPAWRAYRNALADGLTIKL